MIAYTLSVLVGWCIVGGLLLAVRGLLVAHTHGMDRVRAASHAPSVSPDACPFCRHRGWHHEGCSKLDQLDTPRRTA